ncbi:MAG: ATP-binding cassette domain-containing protein, partial [Actinomycetota bacterium]
MNDEMSRNEGFEMTEQQVMNAPSVASNPIIRQDVKVSDAVAESSDAEPVFRTRELAVYYGDFRAVRDVNLDIRGQEITAFIGPSGCGKTTVLRCFDRMNDLIAGARVEGD